MRGSPRISVLALDHGPPKNSTNSFKEAFLGGQVPLNQFAQLLGQPRENSRNYPDSLQGTMVKQKDSADKECPTEKLSGESVSRD